MSNQTKAIVAVAIAAALFILGGFIQDSATYDLIVNGVAGIAATFGIANVRQLFNGYTGAKRSKTVWGVGLVVLGVAAAQLLPMLALPAPWPLVIGGIISLAGAILGAKGLTDAVTKGTLNG